MKKFTLIFILCIVAGIGASSQIQSTKSLKSGQVSTVDVAIEGVWKIDNIGIYCNNFNWETWGWDKYELINNYLPELNPELDNIITITTQGTNGDGMPYGSYENHVGIDGENGSFTDINKSWDFTSRLRTVPLGTGTWVLDGTNLMITVGGFDYSLIVESGSTSDEIALASNLEYLSNLVNWTDTDWNYEELAHTSQKMWYSLSKSSSTAVGESEFEGYGLNQNFPNPASNSTNICFRIPVASLVSIKVIDLQGKEVRELAGNIYGAGSHMIEFNCQDLPSGIYFYTIKSEGFTATRKMIISKN